MVTVWCSVASLIHYSFLNPSETITSEKYAQQIDLLFSCSVMFDSLRPHGLQHARFPLSITISWSLLKLMSIESMMPSNHLILCCPLPLQPSVFFSIRVFAKELALCVRWLKYWNFSFRISVLLMNIQD